jgi:hypothetical protein
VIVAAALCASPPLLHPALTGRDVVLPELRAACAEAVARLLGEDPETVVVVGPAVATGEWEPDGVLDSTAFAPGAASGGSGRGSLPLSLGLGAMLLDQAGYRGPRRLRVPPWAPNSPSGRPGWRCSSWETEVPVAA